MADEQIRQELCGAELCTKTASFSESRGGDKAGIVNSDMQMWNLTLGNQDMRCKYNWIFLLGENFIIHIGRNRQPENAIYVLNGF